MKIFDIFRQEELIWRLLKNAGILLSGNVGASIFGFISLALTARGLGTEGLGILVMISAYVLVIDKLVNFQSWQALIKYGAEALEEGRDDDFKSLLKFGFLLDIGTALAGTLIAAGGSLYVGRWQGWNPDTVTMATIYSVTIIFHIAGTPTAILRLFNCFKLFSMITISSAAIKLIGVSVAFLSGAGLWAFLLTWALTNVFSNILLITLALRELESRRYHAIHRASISHMPVRFQGLWGFVITTNLNSSIRMASREADVLVIGSLLTPSAVGLYKVAKQIASVLTTLNDPLYQTIYPELAKLSAQGNYSEMIRLARRSAVFSGTIALLIFGALALVADYLLNYFFGSEFVAAYWVMFWYVLAQVIAIIGFSLQPIMLSIGQPKTTFHIHIISTIAYFLILFILIEFFGLKGAGIAYLSYYLVWSLLMIVFVLKFLKDKI